MDVAQLRKMASETLAQASKDGRLAKALASSKSGQMDAEHLRKLAAIHWHRLAKMDGER